ncbi:MAG: hypothetical protein IT374_20155 [Polyangiaceae bacterium]|nr:hypothetical protein [Polyangiaceae bacterium]
MSARTAARAAAWWLGAAVVAHVATEALSERPLGAVVIAAVGVDFVAGRAGAPWIGGEIAAAARRGVAGALLGVALVVVSTVALVAVGQGRLSFALEPVSLALGVVGAIAAAVRVELLARHLPDALLGRWLGARGGAIVAILAGTAPLALSTGARPAAFALALATGALSVTLMRAWGTVAAVGARAGLSLASTALLGDVRWARGGLSPLELASGPPAVALSVVALHAAAVVAWRAPASARRAE